jgi:hypothetical protein
VTEPTLVSVPYPFLSSNGLSLMATNESKADPLATYAGYSFADDQSYQVSLSPSSMPGQLEKLPKKGRSIHPLL